MLNPVIRYQTIIGWEATAQAGQVLCRLEYAIRTVLLIKLWQMESTVFVYNYKFSTEANTANLSGAVNDNSDPFSINPSGFQWNNNNGVKQQVEVINMMRTRLAARGEPMPYVVLCYVDFRAYAFEHHSNPEEYAELMEATFMHLSSTYGWTPDAVELLLEPDHSNSDWTAAKLANCLIATRARLASRGWNPRFIGPSTTLCDSADVWYNAMKAANSSIGSIHRRTELSQIWRRCWLHTGPCGPKQNCCRS